MSRTPPARPYPRTISSPDCADPPVRPAGTAHRPHGTIERATHPEAWSTRVPLRQPACGWDYVLAARWRPHVPLRCAGHGWNGPPGGRYGGICYATLVAAHDGLITVMVCEVNASSGTMSWDGRRGFVRRDRRHIQTAVLGSSASEEPLMLPLEAIELDAFRRRHENDTFWCGLLLGGCGIQLTTRLYTDRVCHFAHHPGPDGLPHLCRGVWSFCPRRSGWRDAGSSIRAGVRGRAGWVSAHEPGMRDAGGGSEPPADPGRGETTELGRPLPGAAEVGGQRSGQAELGVGGDDQPGPPVRRRGRTESRAGPCCGAGAARQTGLSSRL